MEQFSTPQTVVQAGKRKWENFLHAQKLFHPEWHKKRLEIFAKADTYSGAPAVTAAKSPLAVTMAKLLLTLERQLAAPRTLIDECFHAHPAHALFQSLPGAGRKLAPRLLSELMALRP